MSDWSSDVCSSDLPRRQLAPGQCAAPGCNGELRSDEVATRRNPRLDSAGIAAGRPGRVLHSAADRVVEGTGSAENQGRPIDPAPEEIGRATWRERVCQYGYISVVATPLNKKTEYHTTRRH